MDAADILTPNVDKTQIPPLHHKRILAFVNHFLISSCEFLNDFAVQCETKFIELERKLQKVEAALLIIESKLASIPDAGSDSVQTATKVQETTNEPLNQNDEKDSTEKEVGDGFQGSKISEHNIYKKFFKMLQVGVPCQAIKIKMQAEGLDPNVLDNPNIMISIDDSKNSNKRS